MEIGKLKTTGEITIFSVQHSFFGPTTKDVRGYDIKPTDLEWRRELRGDIEMELKKQFENNKNLSKENKELLALNKRYEKYILEIENNKQKEIRELSKSFVLERYKRLQREIFFSDITDCLSNHTDNCIEHATIVIEKLYPQPIEIDNGKI